MKKSRLAVAVFVTFCVVHGPSHAASDEDARYLQQHFDELKAYAKAYQNRNYPICATANWTGYDDCNRNVAVYKKDPNKRQFCLNLLTQLSPVFQKCISVYDDGFKEGMQNLLEKRRQADGGGGANLNSCVAFDPKAIINDMGAPTCNVTVSNSCAKPVVCSVDISGTDGNGVNKSMRQTIHLTSGDTGERGMTGVISCGETSLTCSVWKR